MTASAVNGTALEREVLERVDQDWIEPWLVVRVLTGNGLSDGSANELAKWLVVGLLAMDVLAVGTLHGEGLVRRLGAPLEAATQVFEEWSALGRLPNIGDIGFLELTERGHRRLQELRESNET